MTILRGKVNNQPIVVMVIDLDDFYNANPKDIIFAYDSEDNIFPVAKGDIDWDNIQES